MLAGGISFLSETLFFIRLNDPSQIINTIIFKPDVFVTEQLE